MTPAMKQAKEALLAAENALCADYRQPTNEGDGADDHVYHLDGGAVGHGLSAVRAALAALESESASAPRVWEVTEERKAALLSAADDDETAALGALTMAEKERYSARGAVLRAMLLEAK